MNEHATGSPIGTDFLRHRAYQEPSCRVRGTVYTEYTLEEDSHFLLENSERIEIPVSARSDFCLDQSDVFSVG